MASDFIEMTLGLTEAALGRTDDPNERAEAIENLLAVWYDEWPETAATSPHGPIAAELVRLLDKGTVARVVRAATIRELVGSDEVPGLLDEYFVRIGNGGGPAVWHCRRCDHIGIVARNLHGDDQTNLTVGEMAESALDHEAEYHDA